MLPLFAERFLLEFRRKPYVLDLDDAFFHVYESIENSALNWLLRDKIDRLMQYSAFVFAGNQYIADRAVAAGAPRVEILPTVVDTMSYRVKQKFSRERFTVGWLGSFSTTKHLRLLAPVIHEFARQSGVEFVAMGADGDVVADLPIKCVPWTEAGEIDFLLGLDVGIMPLVDSAFARGKCGFKLIQYMACGIPTVASPVGVNSNIVKHGETGFLAVTEDDWRAAFTSLKQDTALRQLQGERGRQVVCDAFALDKWVNTVSAAFKELASTRTEDETYSSSPQVRGSRIPNRH